MGMDYRKSMWVTPMGAYQQMMNEYEARLEEEAREELARLEAREDYYRERELELIEKELELRERELQLLENQAKSKTITKGILFVNEE